MDTMQARIEQLEQENAALRALLKKHGITYPETAENQISAAADQGSRMLQNEVTPQMVSFSIPISEAAKMYTASAAAQRTAKRDIFRSVRILGITNSARKRQGRKLPAGTARTGPISR